MKEKILVSSCLFGNPCRYDAKAVEDKNVIEYLKDKEVISICPELMAGLSAPRPSCEIYNGRVINTEGEDLTDEFHKGAQMVLQIAKDKGIKKALLKSKSPSCGSGIIYDGTFSSKLISGDGVCAQTLKAAGITVINNEDLPIR